MALSAARRKTLPGRALLQHDRAAGRFVAGTDEAGRGCLAGPLVAAAVVLDTERLRGPEAAPLAQLNDSKQLAPELRERMFQSVCAAATSWSVTVISPGRIDRDGLHVCNLQALRSSLERIQIEFDVAFVDGFDLGDTPFPSHRLVRGDSTSAAIAAASIIAKVSRDRLMTRLDHATGDRWAFAEHHGYATPLHHDRIQMHGVSRYHRRSFASKAYIGAPDAMHVTAGV